MVNIPDTYWGETVDVNGLFRVMEDRLRIIDHVCGTWYYGHDDMFDGGCRAWMRLREKVDRSDNDVKQMVVENGVWRLNNE